MSKYLVSTYLFQWTNSYVHPEKRASYSGNKEIISLIGGIIFSLVMGAVFDWFEAGGNLAGGFLGIFKTDDNGNGLAMMVLLAQIITMVGNILRIPVTSIFGKYSDKRSFASGFYLSMFFGVACIIFMRLIIMKEKVMKQ